MSFGSKKTATTSTTQNTSSTRYTDSSINAGGDGSLALGAGAQVNTTVIDVSEGVARASLEAQRDTAAAALAANRDVSGLAIETTGKTAEQVINAAVDLYSIGSRERADAMKNDALLLQSNQGLVGKLTELTGAALERSQTPDSAVTKQLLWVVGAVAVAGAFIFSRSRR